MVILTSVARLFLKVMVTIVYLTFIGQVNKLVIKGRTSRVASTGSWRWRGCSFKCSLSRYQDCSTVSAKWFLTRGWWREALHSGGFWSWSRHCKHIHTLQFNTIYKKYCILKCNYDNLYGCYGTIVGGRLLLGCFTKPPLKVLLIRCSGCDYDITDFWGQYLHYCLQSAQRLMFGVTD